MKKRLWWMSKALGLPWVRWIFRVALAFACSIAATLFGSAKFGLVGGIVGAFAGAVVGFVLFIIILTLVYPGPRLSNKPKSGKNIPEFLRIITYISLGGIAGYALLETWWGAVLGAFVVIVVIGAIEVIQNPYFPEDDE